MATTNHERVGKALELLKAGLGPFVDREVQSAKAQRVDPATLRRFVDDPQTGDRPVAEWDAAALLKLMLDTWNDVFRVILGPAERGFVDELHGHRNRWAHQEAFSGDDAYRALDTVHRLLTAVSAAQAADVEKLKMELLRVRFDEQARGERRKQASLALGSTAGTLKPWREVVTPHRDVASGRYQQAEFAADLWQAHLGEGTDEYRDPVEFFRRTYLTESLKRMLIGAVQRLTGGGGDPVVQLQTNFGGGKTHSMLALYHLCSGVAPSALAGVDALLRDAGVPALPNRKKPAVLVGNRISPGNPVTKDDGTVVRTLWGELAWQIGGAEAYARIAKDDEHATSPGDALRQLLVDYGPCLILIDEWVAYARQLHDQSDLPAGSFETQFTFAQALTESVKLAGNCLLVISLPASDNTDSPHTRADDVEVGGQRGREALDRLRNVIGRIESSWRPASAEEGFEIVRRRLFEPFADPERYKDRDVVVRAFADFYRSQHQEFPPECRAADGARLEQHRSGRGGIRAERIQAGPSDPQSGTGCADTCRRCRASDARLCLAPPSHINPRPAPPRHATATPRPRPAVIQARGLTADECAAILATCMQRRRTGRGLERTETAERRASESASPGSRRAGMVRMIERPGAGRRESVQPSASW